MDLTGQTQREPLGAVLSQLRDALLAQAEALSAEDFDGLEHASAEREQLAAQLDQYTPADTQPEDRALLDQIGALDQRLLALVQAGLEQTRHELRDIHRGRGALNEYRQRGNNLIRNLSRLDVEG